MMPILPRVLARDSLAAPLGPPTPSAVGLGISRRGIPSASEGRGGPALADFLARPRCARTPWPLENLNVRLAKSRATRGGVTQNKFLTTSLQLRAARGRADAEPESESGGRVARHRSPSRPEPTTPIVRRGEDG